MQENCEVVIGNDRSRGIEGAEVEHKTQDAQNECTFAYD